MRDVVRTRLASLAMALVALALVALALTGCVAPPRPFEHDSDDVPRYAPKQEAAEVTIETPANMPDKMAERVAVAVAIELQSYGIVAAVRPARAPLKITSAMSTRDSPTGNGIEVEVDWYLMAGAKAQGPVTTRTTTPANDYGDASDTLVSRVAQQAAPRIAGLMGKTPTVDARSIGAVVAGVGIPENPSEPATPQTASAEGAARPAPAAPAAPQIKVAVAPITGAPSDGNQQLFSGMRRALGSNKIVLADKGGGDTFTVTGAVTTKSIDERTILLAIRWTLKDPSGKEVGNIEQSNPVPAAAARGSWVGFGDIVAAAAVEGVVELLEKALNKSR
jgi:hypothetical protein